jgi:hypothetical protein
MMNKTLMLTVLAGLLVALAAPAAQAQSEFGVAWSLGLPMGDTKDFAPGFSARGVAMDWRTYRTRDFAFGGSIGWNVFNESDSGTFTNGVVSITGKRYRTVNAVPIMAGAYRYFGAARNAPRWYVGLNGGTIWTERRALLGIYGFEESNWHLAMAPEVGVKLPWDAFLGYVALRYNVAFAAGDVDAQQWFELKLGFGLD